MNTANLAALRARFEALATEPDTRDEFRAGVGDEAPTLSGGYVTTGGRWVLCGTDGGGDAGDVAAHWPEWVALAEAVLGVSRAEVASLLTQTERGRVIEAATRRYLDAEDVVNGDGDHGFADTAAMWEARDALCSALGKAP